MLQQLNRLALPTAISIASFEAVFFVVGSIFDLTEREVVLGVLAGGVGGLSVLFRSTLAVRKEGRVERDQLIFGPFQ